MMKIRLESKLNIVIMKKKDIITKLYYKLLLMLIKKIQ